MNWKPTSLWSAVRKKETDAYIQGLKDAMRILNKEQKIYPANVMITTLMEDARNGTS